jgi:hypothetical protein
VIPSTMAPCSSHRLTEVRSLAMHTVIAEKLRRDPKLLALAQRNLERWRNQRRERPPEWITERSQILRRPWPEVAAAISEPSERGARLRQSSPFAGVLSPQERQRIYDAFRA